MGKLQENIERKQETMIEHARILVAEGDGLHDYIMNTEVEKPQFHGDMGEGSHYIATWMLEEDCDPEWHKDLPEGSKVRADEHFHNISQWNLLGHAADITSWMLVDQNTTIDQYYEKIKEKNHD